MLPVHHRPRRLLLPIVLWGALLLLVTGCLTDNPATPTPLAPPATAAPASATPGAPIPAPALDTATPAPPGPDQPVSTGTPGDDNTTLDVIPPDLVTREATPNDSTPTPAAVEIDTPVPTAVATATRTPRPSATPTVTPTTIPTTVAIAGLKAPARLVAFERDGQIWTITTDGKTARQLSKDGRNYRPVWAPDGKTLAFLSNRDDPRYRIYFMDPDGGNVREVSGPILAGPGGDKPDLFGLDYAFSPNGQRLVYIAQIEPYVRAQLMLLDVVGGDIRPLTQPEGVAPTAPPSPTPPPTETPTATPTETPTRDARAPAGTPATPPAPAHTATAPPAIPTTTPPPPPVTAQQVMQPAWASDNRTLAYVDNSDLEQDVLYLLDVDTGKRALLTQDNAVNRSPIFSKDGKTVFFTSSAGAAMMTLQSELYSIQRTGKGRAKLAPGFTAAPGWGTLHLAPNGAKLVVDWSERLGGFGDPWSNEVTIMTTAGKTPLDLTAAYPRPYYGGDSPSWAPDSRFLAFHLYYCADAQCSKGANKILVADTTAKKVTLAVLTDGVTPAWQP